MRIILLALTLLSFSSQAQIQSIAGTGEKGFSGDNGPAEKAQLNNPFGLTLGPDHALYWSDSGHIYRGT